jgi:hypothetical protein
MLIRNNPYTMSGRLFFQTRALGAEPDAVDTAALADWIADHRGIAADLISYNIDRLLSPQLSAGVPHPCAGGLFMRERVAASLIGVREQAVESELAFDAEALLEDISLIRAKRRDIWCALPSPGNLGLRDAYFNDDEEFGEALVSVYRSSLRTMRDAGIAGHVLIAMQANELEISSLIRKNILFFLAEPEIEDLEILLEYQTRVAIGKHMARAVLDLAEEYTISQVIIVDADQDAVALALNYMDAEKIVIGGYCAGNCEGYWGDLIKRSSDFKA